MKSLVPLLLFSFCLSAFALAQDNTNRVAGVALDKPSIGSISGAIKSSDGSPVSQATITVVKVAGGSQTNATAQIQADEHGAYVARSLSPGQYRVTVSAPNFRRMSKVVRVIVHHS